jgi:hypothetical protein
MESETIGSSGVGPIEKPAMGWSKFRESTRSSRGDAASFALPSQVNDSQIESASMNYSSKKKR